MLGLLHGNDGVVHGYAEFESSVLTVVRVDQSVHEYKIFNKKIQYRNWMAYPSAMEITKNSQIPLDFFNLGTSNTNGCATPGVKVAVDEKEDEALFLRGLQYETFRSDAGVI